ncbi:MAG: hypothetical protein QM640_09345 [Niabella sp.]
MLIAYFFKESTVAAAAESTVAAAESIVAFAESAVAATSVLKESAVAAADSSVFVSELLQAAKEAAIKAIANNFFMIVFFVFKIIILILIPIKQRSNPVFEKNQKIFLMIISILYIYLLNI